MNTTWRGRLSEELFRHWKFKIGVRVGNRALRAMAYLSVAIAVKQSDDEDTVVKLARRQMHIEFKGFKKRVRRKAFGSRLKRHNSHFRYKRTWISEKLINRMRHKLRKDQYDFLMIYYVYDVSAKTAMEMLNMTYWNFIDLYKTSLAQLRQLLELEGIFAP
jgi:hypothetical protein